MSPNPTPAEPTARELAAEEARENRARLADTLRGWVGHQEGGRLTLAARSVGRGLAVVPLEVRSRGGKRRAPPVERVAERMAECGRRAVLLRERATGVQRRVPLGCSLRLCPVCLRIRGARALARWAPVLQAACADGASVHHATLTQWNVALPGGMVLPDEEARGWRGTVPTGDGETVAPPTVGESLGASYDRLRSSLDSFKQNRSTRAAWFDAMGGALMGFEATGRNGWAGRRKGSIVSDGIPRWHVHCHILTVHPAGSTGPKALRSLGKAWAKLTGAAHWAQKVTRVSDGVSGAVEVMKYPLKLHDLSAAQVVEAIETWSGARLHQRAGEWYAHPRRPPREPWARWLDAMPAHEAIGDCLHLWRGGAGEEPTGTLYTGQIVDGDALFSWGPTGERFRAEVHPFAARVLDRDPPAAVPYVAAPEEVGDLIDELV